MNGLPKEGRTVPAPGTHQTELLTYPLIVVEESDVMSGLAFSSDRAPKGRLTNAANNIRMANRFIGSGADASEYAGRCKVKERRDGDNPSGGAFESCGA